MNKLFKFICSLLLVGICFSMSSCSLFMYNYLQNAEPEDKEEQPVIPEKPNPSGVVYAWSVNKIKRINLSDLLFTGENVIAPGVMLSAKFNYNTSNKEAPEVSYLFEINVEVEDPSGFCSNKSILWKLDDGAWGTFAELEAQLLALSGSNSGMKYYQPGQLPTSCGEHTISVKWNFDESSNDTNDTEIGTREMPTIYFVIIATQQD